MAMMDRSPTPPTPPPLSPSILPQSVVPEVSMVEAEDVTGVTFTPELWMQRRHWALEVLRAEGVRSVLDIGCGTGSLLETLVIPPTTIHEPPIRARPANGNKNDQVPSPSYSDTDAESEAEAEGRELFILRAGGLDSNPATINSALSIIQPPTSTSTFPPRQPRWEPLSTELWLGVMERYNSRLEGYEAITALEVIEHLDPHILSRFGVVTMGTYRPRILLVTTPNFDFNAKFPRDHDHDFAHKGFVDPTGRTERVFRHSDHKLEMTHREFVDWAESAAADWGYSVEVGGVGISSKPSYYPSEDPNTPPQPVYATSTALFRLGAAGPARSPRSVRTTELPFMPGSSQSSHPHNLAGRFLHPRTAPTSHHSERKSSGEVRQVVKQTLENWQVGEVSLTELWGNMDVAAACAGSKRYLVGCLGGWGDVDAIEPAGESEVMTAASAVAGASGQSPRGKGLVVRWNGFKKDQPPVDADAREWGKSDNTAQGAPVPVSGTEGW